MRKIMTALTALSLIAAPTTVAYAQVDRGTGEELSDDQKLQLGHGVAIAIVALGALFAILLILDDDDEAESP